MDTINTMKKINDVCHFMKGSITLSRKELYDVPFYLFFLFSWKKKFKKKFDKVIFEKHNKYGND